MRWIALPVPVLVAAVLACGCQSKPDTTGQSTQGFYASSADTLWDLSEQTLNRSGFVVDSEASSRENLTMVSRWKTSLQPFSFKGWREQATLTFHAIEGKPDYWTVEANVLRQTNLEEREPNNPVKARWKGGERMPAEEMRLVHDIEMAFLTRDVSPEFRARYGMPPPPPPVAPPSMGEASKDK